MVGAMLKAPTLVEKYDISHVNTVVVGASNLSKEVATQFTNLIPGCKLTQGYGLTETTVAVTFENPLDIMFGSCGHLFPGCEGRLIDDNGQDIEEYDHPGELLVRSPTIMLGYLDNEVETRAMLSEDGWLRTGDLVRFKKSPNGHDHLFLIDRIKELIKVRVSITLVLILLLSLIRHRVCKFLQ
jgi:long-subunit acyl-CoA synthetase (AMP-forming)